jgi:hypothetical protein
VQTLEYVWPVALYPDAPPWWAEQNEQMRRACQAARAVVVNSAYMVREVEWLAGETALAPGEGRRLVEPGGPDTTQITVNQALAEHRHLVVLGDPGSGRIRRHHAVRDAHRRGVDP